MKIKVEKEHIEAGERYSASVCPIALAMEKFFPPEDYLSDECLSVQYSLTEWAGETYSLFVVLPNRERTELPPFVQEWVEKFDRGETVESIEFEL